MRASVEMSVFFHLSNHGPNLQACHSHFIRGLLCTLLVAFPAMAEPVTGLDDIKLGANRTLRLVVRPEAQLRAGRDCSRYDENCPGTRRSRCDQHHLDDQAPHQFELPACGDEHASERSRSGARGVIRFAAKPRMDARRGLYLHGTREARRGPRLPRQKDRDLRQGAPKLPRRRRL